MWIEAIDPSFRANFQTRRTFVYPLLVIVLMFSSGFDFFCSYYINFEQNVLEVCFSIILA